MCPAAEVRARPAAALVEALSELGRDLAQRAWSEHGGSPARVPRYPALRAWTALADTLRRWRVERVDRRAHAAFVAAYRERLNDLERAGAQSAPALARRSDP